jgi:hypothetical protein
MSSESIPHEEAKASVSHRIPISVIRDIEYRAYLDRTTKSDALTKLVRGGVAALGQQTPADPQERAVPHPQLSGVA